MNEKQQFKHEQWSSGWIFTLAAIGSAVGLGNIWKFPYITGENGGGAFVLVYLFCILLIGIPVMIAEVMLGRRGQHNPDIAMYQAAIESERSTKWRVVGLLGILAGIILTSYYSVIAGWSFPYILYSLQNTFTGASPLQIKAIFQNMLASPWVLLLCHTGFILLTFSIIYHGIKHGVEKVTVFMMPFLFILIVILLFFSGTTGAFMQGVKFVFDPDFSKLTWKGVLVATGHAFFTLSLAMGAIMVYGSYLPKKVSIPKTVLIIGAMDTLVALMMALIIFPLVFAYGLESGQGPGLIFNTLPIAFSQMLGGQIMATLFFVLFFVTALTSAISIVEAPVAWLAEKCNISRHRSCLIVGLVIWTLGIGSILSFNSWSTLPYLNAFFNEADFIVSSILLPLGGALIAFFTGWCMKRAAVHDELAIKDKHLIYRIWMFCLQIIAPIAIALIMIEALWQRLHTLF